MSKKNVNKDIVIETALQLIDEKGGIKDVNLREIAKTLGCAHTNLYNYFSSLDEIFWEALGQALLHMMKYSEDHSVQNLESKDEFYLFLTNYIEFSLDHPGWYRLIWLEPIGGSPSEKVMMIMQKPSEDFIQEIIHVSNNELSLEEADTIGDILHGYLHGELCKYINKRSVMNDKNEIIRKMLINLKFLINTLM